MSKKCGKRLKNIKKELEDKVYDPVKAIDLLKKYSSVKFSETLEVALNLGIDVRKSTQVVRGVVKLPFGTGKKVRIAVICKEDKFELAKESGADVIGFMNIIEDIKKNKIDFDVCVATPDVMGVIGQVAKILGPKGLMPNPKLGTVTNDIKSIVNDIKGGQVEFRSDKTGIIHAGIGKLSFNSDDLLGNLKMFLDTVIKSKPAEVKKAFVKSCYVCSTMGPSLRLNVSSLMSC